MCPDATHPELLLLSEFFMAHLISEPLNYIVNLFPPDLTSAIKILSSALFEDLIHVPIVNAVGPSYRLPDGIM